MNLVRVVTAINIPCIVLKLTDLPLFSNLSISPCKMCVIDGLVEKLKCSLICVTIIKCDVTVTTAAKPYTCIIEGIFKVNVWWGRGWGGMGWRELANAHLLCMKNDVLCSGRQVREVHLFCQICSNHFKGVDDTSVCV